MSDDDVIATEPITEDVAAAKKREKFLKRRFTAETAPPALTAAGVEQVEWWPSKSQFTRWWMYVVEDMGADDCGWWYARCPIHDPLAEGEMSALISFQHGVVRCLTEDGEKCHPGRKYITLQNAREGHIERVLGANDAATPTA